MKVTAMQPLAIQEQMPLALYLHGVVRDELDASEYAAQSLNLTQALLRRVEDSFATYARDNQLSARGIDEGDLLLADKSLKPQHKDVVIASLDGELLCRILDMNEGCLRTADDSQSPIFLHEHVSLVIEGVVLQSVKQWR